MAKNDTDKKDVAHEDRLRSVAKTDAAPRGEEGDRSAVDEAAKSSTFTQTLGESEEVTQPQVTSALGVQEPDGSLTHPVYFRNAEREARALRDQVAADVDESDGKVRSLRLSEGRGPRDAADLAFLIRLYPEAVNMLDRLDEVERSHGVEEPDAWAADPVTMLQAATVHNFQFPGENYPTVESDVTPRTSRHR